MTCDRCKNKYHIICPLDIKCDCCNKTLREIKETTPKNIFKKLIKRGKNMTWTLITVNEFKEYNSSTFHGPNGPTQAWEKAESLIASSSHILIGLIPGDHKMHKGPNYKSLHEAMTETTNKILIENN